MSAEMTAPPHLSDAPGRRKPSLRPVHMRSDLAEGGRPATIFEPRVGEVAESFCAAARASTAIDRPWRHWQLADVLPRDVLRRLTALPLSAGETGGMSGRREFGNEQRIYCDAANMARFPVMRRVAQALHSPAVTDMVCDVFGAPLGGTFLRIEYALDTDGFWLEPHTDIGVKKFTCFLYLDGAGDLGTDIYADPQTLMRRVPFIPNSALVFVPGDDTWHGFAPRPIDRVRRSLIINFVGPEWRAREQLAFPDEPVRLDG
ncbi:MAG: hypothetical protein NVSMB26_28220 [Beijerinckiaceae bacterium]